MAPQDSQLADAYRTTHQSWDKVAGLYEETFRDVALYNDTYDLFCALVENRGARILEIGCGPGNITRYLLSKRPDFRVEAIDVSQAMIALARKAAPGAAFRVMDCRDLDRVDARYDGIVCGFCAPYLSREDCEKLIADCANLLWPGGSFYLSVTEGDYAQSGYEQGSSGDRMFVFYHSEAFLRAALAKAGFAEPAAVRKTFQNKNGKPSTHLIILAKKI